jgi:hypothetical protein
VLTERAPHVEVEPGQLLRHQLGHVVWPEREVAAAGAAICGICGVYQSSSPAISSRRRT